MPRNPHFIEVTKRFLMEMPIAQYLGFDITDVALGRFEITQPFRRELSFRERAFQAGPVGTLADMAAACAGATMLAEGWAASTVDCTLKLLAPALVRSSSRVAAFSNQDVRSPLRLTMCSPC
jgi:acyl-coenzyme A thioesterase PaaI-like protein